MDDGKFEVTIITNAWQWLVLHLTRFLKRPLDNCYPKLVQFQTDMLEIIFNGDSFYQIDGEILGGFSEGGKHLIFQTASLLAMVVP
jgi:diacylglycerol kinase family enzyme